MTALTVFALLFCSLEAFASLPRFSKHLTIDPLTGESALIDTAFSKDKTAELKDLGFKATDPFTTGKTSYSIMPNPPYYYATWFESNAIDAEYRARQQIVLQMNRFTKMSHVPYIWGGNRIGNIKTCKRCRSCIQRTKARVKYRNLICPACKKCGIDCSHLVTTIYKNAGIEFPYATTQDFLHKSAPQLAARYGLLDLGQKVEVIEPGDLLLYKKHVVIVMATYADGTAGILHSTAVDPKHRAGGIRYEEKVPVARFRGKIRKILRHKRLATNQPDSES